jgi:twitching motility protein PilT
VNEANLVPSLLQAIVNIDGDALVMHAGDKPYVVSPSGQVELASRGLTLEAVNGIVMQLLPIEFQQALDEFGAIQYSLTSKDEFPNERFTVVVARGGDDVWAEIRRRRVPDDDLVPMELFGTPAPPTESPYPSAVPDLSYHEPVERAQPISPFAGPTVLKYESTPPEPSYRWSPPAEVGDADLKLHDREELAAPIETGVPVPPVEERKTSIGFSITEMMTRAAEPVLAPESAAPQPVAFAPPVELPPVPESFFATPEIPVATYGSEETPAPVNEIPVPPAVAPPDVPTLMAEPEAPTSFVHAPTPVPPVEPTIAAPAASLAPSPKPAPPIEAAATSEDPSFMPMSAKEPAIVELTASAAQVSVPPTTMPQAAATIETAAPAPTPQQQPPSAAASRLSPPPGVVLPMSRGPIRPDQPQGVGAGETLTGLERLLRTAAARGASTLYLSSDARPSVRIDGDLQSLDSEPVHTSADVTSLLLSLMPDRSHETLRAGATTEWTCDIEDLGRVRCTSFSDYRGPGGVFRLMAVRSVSADQLGLSQEIQSLALEPEGLVLVTGSRSSGKRAVISSLVDLINRSRRDHVITIEREVNIVHPRGSSFISQREVRGADDDVLAAPRAVLAAARAALREDPDVLVLEEIRTGLLMDVALEAAASGCLVIGGFSAHNVTESVDRILGSYAPEYARQVQLALADNLRGVVAQVLLPKSGGGRVVAREVLLNTPAVASIIAEGKTSQLQMAIEGGRRVGMVPFNDALVSYVQSGVVDVRDAYRHVTDRPAFLALLKRQGVDTSSLERLA